MPVSDYLKGFLGMLLHGETSTGIKKPLNIDTSGDLQLDVLSMPSLTVSFTTGTTTPAQIALGDAASVGVSSLASKEDHKHFYLHTGLADVWLSRGTTTRLDLAGLAGTSKLMEINGEYVSYSTLKSCLTSDNVISSTGTDSAAAAALNTTYYVYASNSLASYAASSVRLCATAPTAGYLAGSGNGAHWRHVGWARTDASTQFADAMAVASAINSVITVNKSNHGSSTPTNVGVGWEEVLTDLATSVLLPAGWTVECIGKVDVAHTTAGSTIMCRIYYDDASQADSLGRDQVHANNATQTIICQHSRTAAALEYVEVEVYTLTGANTATYQSATNNLILTRIPNNVA